jgi:hypothetical protein
MKKLTLNLDRLEVESFVTDEAAAGRLGTVHGRQKEPPDSGPETVCTATLQCREGGDGGDDKKTTLCTAVGGRCEDDDAPTTLCTKIERCRENA